MEGQHVPSCLMKVFDSGMPEEAYWASLFDVPAILAWLAYRSIMKDDLKVRSYDRLR